MISQRSVLSRLIHAGQTIAAKPHLATAMQADIAELERDIPQVGLDAVNGIPTLLAALVELAGKPMIVGSHCLQLAFIAGQAVHIARDHLHYVVSREIANV